MDVTIGQTSRAPEVKANLYPPATNEASIFLPARPHQNSPSTALPPSSRPRQRPLAKSGSPAAQAPVADASRLSTPLLSLIPQPAQTLAAREAAVGRRLEGRRDHPTALPERPGLPQVPAWGEEEDVREARVAAAEGDRLL